VREEHTNATDQRLEAALAVYLRGSKGFDCAGCHKEFESLGLRCCSTQCERRHREQRDKLAVMAEVGVQPSAKRGCEAPGCEATIPKWRKGRKVSSATRYCSPKCARKAKRLSGSLDGILVAETIKKTA
jgi:hypothetical protein